MIRGDRHPRTLTSISNPSLRLHDPGKQQEAERLLREDLEVEILGQDATPGAGAHRQGSGTPEG